MTIRLSIIASSVVLAACGGGGSSLVQSDTPLTTTGTSNTPSTTTQTQVAMTMSCGTGVASCSGSGGLIGSATASPSGVDAADRPTVGYTSSSVQTYAKSTNDQASTAYGLAPASGGQAEMRLTKDANGAVTGIALILSNIGISWDGTNQRPTIIETFRTSQGRVQLGSNGDVVSTALSAPGTASFYDHNYAAKTGTQGNYANNSYFPRTEPARCPTGMTATDCANETDGVHYLAGNWRTGGNTPDHTTASRRHEDGDIHAGYTVANPAEGSTGWGVPYAGSKGYRSADVWSYQYSNLGAWTTQDTVQISEWAPAGLEEHNKVRRGLLAFGDTTDPATIPTSGTATYSNGFAYGWYSATRMPTRDPDTFMGTASATANFASRTVDVTVANTTITNTTTAVPAGFSGTLNIGTGNNANYYSGNISANGMSGVASGRFFGPVSNGAGGNGPAETGGVYSMTNGTSTVMGGFIARKQ